MRRLLADESVDGPVIAALRRDGWTILSVAETNPSIADTDVVAMAVAQHLPVLTFDRDFGELVFRIGVELPPAVIYVRTKSLRLPEIIERVIDGLQQADIGGTFLTIDRHGVRSRPLPLTGADHA